MKGAVASGNAQSTHIAAEVLRAGGNAVDAAVAGVFASFVSEVVLTNPGAGGVGLVHEPSGAIRAFDFFSTAPGLGHAAPPPVEQLDFRRITIDFGNAASDYWIGRGAVAVPSIIKGMEVLHARYGRMPWRELVLPAARLAREGVCISPMHRMLFGIIKCIMTDTPEMAAACGGADNYLSTMDRFRIPQLAPTLEHLAHAGPEDFYTGDIARAIVADQRTRGGLMTLRDLAEYRVLELEPHRIPFEGWTVATMPLPSLGGTMVAVMLSLWEALADRQGHPAPGSAARAHRWGVVIEAVNSARDLVEQHAAAGANAPQLVEAMVDHLRWPAENAIREGRPWRATPPPRVPGNTTHISTVDADGLAVSVTQSAGESAGFMVPGLGLMMNNMMGEGDLHHEGFHRKPPGTRLRTMMAPTIAIHHQNGAQADDHVVAYGSGGSTRIRSAISQFTSMMIHDDLSIREAVDALRVHYEDGRIRLEGPQLPELADRLHAMGYDVQVFPGRSAYFGGVHAARYDRPRRFTAYGDPRRDGLGEVVG